MKNLKRALSFAVAAVMLVGMMAIGTSAFTDDAAIASDNELAVNVMYTLGIINGKPDGSFDPAANVTRAEMAKMICVALNGGKDPILDNTTSSYPDTVGNWAAGYIEYCTAMGIVAGSPDGNFYPSNPVTATEAAKMILIAAGYNAENEKFVNNVNWSTNINILASKNGLYEDVAALPGAQLNRQDAAQMIYNGLYVDIVTYEYALGTDGNGALVSFPVVKSADGKSHLLNEKFGMETSIVTLYDVSYDTEDEEYTYTFDVAVGDKGTEWTGTVDYSDLFMQKVTVLWKQGKDEKLGDDTLYGMFGNGEVLATGVYGDLTPEYDEDEEGVLFGEEYIPTLGDLTAKYAFLKMSDTGAEAYEDVAVLDADGDGYADCLIVYPFTYGQVTYAGKTYIKVDGNKVAFDDETVSIYAGAAEDDWVKIVDKDNTLNGDKTVYTKLETVAGTFTAKKGGEYKMGATWYTELVDGDLKLNTEYNLIVVGKYVLEAEEADDEAAATIADVVYIVDVDAAVTTGFDKNTQKVKVMFTDGTTAIVTANKFGGEKVDNTYKVTADAGLLTYKVDSNGFYAFDLFNSDDYVGGVVDAADEGKFAAGAATYRLNADAVLFAVIDGEVSLVKAADANKWVDADLTGELWGETKNGFTYAQIGILVTNANVDDGDYVYGMIVDETYSIEIDDEDGNPVEYYVVTVWNGEKSVELTAIADENEGVDAWAEGTLVKWFVNGEGETEIEAMGATEAAIVAYDGTTVAFETYGEYTFADDAVILYIDAEEVAGVVEGEIMIADEEEGVYTKNVYFISKDSEITVLVVEINNTWVVEE